jgi:alpha-ketoglutarate-dependent taurine dioxygenase
VIAGLTRDRYSEADRERIAWGFATYWGEAAIQNSKGDRIGHVREDPRNPKPRGCQSRAELTFHSDAYELLTLTCAQNAAQRGRTRLTRTLSVYNEILAARPDLPAALSQGYRYTIAEGHGSASSLTTSAVPIFSCSDDLVSCMFLPKYMRAAAKMAGTALPAALEEALAFFRKTANRDNLVLEFGLEPGEMLVCHNFTNPHARTEYEDDATRKRHLLRLWLRTKNGRPVVPALLERGAVYDRLYREQNG